MYLLYLEVFFNVFYYELYNLFFVLHFNVSLPFGKIFYYFLNSLDFEKHIDFLCYTKDEFEKIKNNSMIVSSALQEGIEITYLFQIQSVEIEK
jgi:hypothetical protein